MSEPLPAREAINKLYELGYGVAQTGTGFSRAASLLLKANVDGQATDGPITVIAHKVVPEGLPNGCLGTVAEARYEIRLAGPQDGNNPQTGIAYSE